MPERAVVEPADRLGRERSDHALGEGAARARPAPSSSSLGHGLRGLSRSQPSPERGRGAKAELEELRARPRQGSATQRIRERLEQPIADEAVTASRHDRRESRLLEQLEERGPLPPGHLVRRGHELYGGDRLSWKG